MNHRYQDLDSTSASETKFWDPVKNITKALFQLSETLEMWMNELPDEQLYANKRNYYWAIFV